MRILDPNPEELPEESHLAGAHGQPEDSQPLAFIGVDEHDFRKAVKMLCTNYDLDSTD